MGTTTSTDDNQLPPSWQKYLQQVREPVPEVTRPPDRRQHGYASKGDGAATTIGVSNPYLWRSISAFDYRAQRK